MHGGRALPVEPADALSNLERSESSVSPAVLDRARALLDALHRLGAPTPFICPTEFGGIQFEWRGGRFDFPRLPRLVGHPGCRVVRICACGNCRRCCRLTTLDYLRRQWTGRAVSGRRCDRLRSRRAGLHNDPGGWLARRSGRRTARGTTRRGRDPDEGRRHDRERRKASSYFHNVPNLVPGNPRGQSRTAATLDLR
jgi:hypothetical protein